VNRFPGFAEQTHSPKTAWGAVKQPVKGCVQKDVAYARRTKNAWYVRYMQPGFSRACAPREAILGSARDRSGNTGSPPPLSAREACRLRTHAAWRSASEYRCPEQKRRGFSRGGARLGG
jgi:hypothetical protein